MCEFDHQGTFSSIGNKYAIYTGNMLFILTHNFYILPYLFFPGIAGDRSEHAYEALPLLQSECPFETLLTPSFISVTGPPFTRAGQFLQLEEELCSSSPLSHTLRAHCLLCAAGPGREALSLFVFWKQGATFLLLDAPLCFSLHAKPPKKPCH